MHLYLYYTSVLQLEYIIQAKIQNKKKSLEKGKGYLSPTLLRMIKKLLVQKRNYMLWIDNLVHWYVVITVETPQRANQLTVEVQVPSDNTIGNSLH